MAHRGRERALMSLKAREKIDKIPDSGEFELVTVQGDVGVQFPAYSGWILPILSSITMYWNRPPWKNSRSMWQL